MGFGLIDQCSPERRPGTRVLSRRQALSLSSSLIVLGMTAAAALAAPVLPQGGQFVAGAGSIGSAGPNGLVVNQLGARGIIDWRSFSIGAGGSLAINNGSGVTLNRVTGVQATQIDGSLTATGSIYLINPQGVVVGPNGKVTAGGAVALTTRDMADGQFMAGSALTASGHSPGDVTNQGVIIAQQGNVLLIGRSVTNTGVIQAPNGAASLIAADSVVLAPASGSDGVYVAPDASASGDVTQAGQVLAASAALTAAGGNVYTLAGNREGLIQAQGTTTVGGQVWLSAPNGAVSAAGTVIARNADGSGGQITAAGGRATTIMGTLDASGTRGGQVLVGVTAPGANLSDATTLADGAAIKTGGPGGAGLVETSGHALSVGLASVVTAGGQWLLDPTNLTIDSTAAATIDAALASTDVTLQTTSGGVSASGVSNTIGVQAAGAGTITVASAIGWSSAQSLTLDALSAIAINAPITSGAGGNLTLTAGGAITVGAALSANVTKLTANGGALTLNSGGTVTGTAAGANAVLLNTTGNFANNAGAAGVQATGVGGYWRIYSANPASSTPGGLTPNFYQYGVANNGAVNGAASGNGLIYSATETLGYSLVDSASNHVTKAYDGTNVIAGGGVTAANLSATGLVSGDSVAPTTGAGTYSQSDVGSSLTVTLAGGVTVTHGGAPVYGYAAGTQVNQAVIGSITPATASISLTGALGKVYDGSTLATLSSGNFTVGGLASGQSITVGQPSAASYDSPNAGTNRTLTVTLGATSYVAGAGVKLTNYTLPTTAQATNVTITPAPVQVVNAFANDKTYDATNAATLDLSNVGLYGLVNASDVTLVTSGASAVFAAGPNVGSSLAVTASGFSLANNTGLASNYAVVQPTGLTASIARAALTISGLSALNKTYDGTTAATLSGSAVLNGVQGSDSITLGGSPLATFASKNVGTGISVSASGYSVSGPNAGDYTLSQPSAGVANITQAPLTVTLNGSTDKTYNGTNVAVVNPANYVISGAASGETVSIAQTTSATYAGVNASATPQAITVALSQTDFSAGGGALLSNYSLPTTTANTPTGLINKAPLSIDIVNYPTKTYDATTAATLTGSNYQISGLIGGQTAAVSQTAGTYDSANAGLRIVTADLTGAVSGSGGFLLSNYSVPITATGPGVINPAPLSLGGSPPYNLNIGIVNNPTKVYDGLLTIALASSNFSLAGLQGGDSISVKPTTGTLGSANAGVQPVQATLNPDSSSYTPGGGTLLSNYTLPTLALGTATVTRAPVTLSIVGDPTKTYNASNVAILSPGNVSFSGLVPSEGVSVSQVASAVYDSADASAGRTITAQFASSDFSLSGGARLANYTFNGVNPESGTVTATGAGAISQAPLTVLGASANSKVYSRTTAATLNAGTLYGVVGAEDVHLTQSSTGDFSQSNVGAGLIVTPTAAYGLSGTANLNNYLLTQPTLTADITKKPLTITSAAANDKPYDGTTAATVTASGLTGVISGDTVSLDASGYAASFKTANAGGNIKVTASGFALGGADDGNYSLVQPSGLTANINKALITANIIGAPTKTYDGGTAAILTSANFSLTGWASGQGADVTVTQQTSADYNSSKATSNGGAASVTASLSPPDFHAAGTNLANYQLPTTATGAGTISLAPLTAQIVNNPTKTYDGTTTFDSTTANTGANAGIGLLTSNYRISGFATGEGSDVTVNKTSAAYATPNAGITTLSNSLAGGDFAASTTDLGNYALPSAASGGGTITQRALTLSLAAQTKVYDGGRTASGLTAASYTLGNFAPGQGGSLVNDPSGLYDHQDVNSATAVSVYGIRTSDISGTGGFLAANYTIPSTVTAAGSITPKTVSLGQVSRIYDGSNLIDGSTHAVTYTVSGLVGSDAVTIDSAGVTGTYNTTTHVGSGLNVSLNGVALASNPGGDYQIASTQTGNFGAITPKTITGSLASQTKVYDGTTTASGLTTASYTLNGFVSGEGAAVGRTSGAYNVKDVTATTVTVAGLTSADYVAAGATQLTDYSLPATISGPGSITQALLRISLASITKVYDGTVNLPTASSAYVLSGVIGGDMVDVANATGSYVSKHVGNNVPVNVSAVTLGGAAAADYTVQLPVANAAIGFITPVALTLSVTGTKVYDGTTASSLTGAGNYVLSGVLAGDTLSVGDTAAIDTGAIYNSKNVIGATTLTVSGLTSADFIASGSSLLTDYILPTSASGAGSITPRPLTATLTAQTKVYDSTTTAAGLTPAMFGLSGFAGAESATVTGHAAGAYNSKNVLTANMVTVTGVAAGDYAGSGGFLSANYSLPTTISGPGTITPAPLSIANLLVNNKVYDGTTAAQLNLASVNANSLTGVYAGDAVILSARPSAAAFATPNVGTGIAVTLSGQSISGADASNYSLSATAPPTANITPRPLMASLIGDPTKAYDGGTLAILTAANFNLTGFVGSQGATVNQTVGAYDAADPGSRTVTAALAPGNFNPTGGALLSNYILPVSASGPGHITPAPNSDLFVLYESSLVGQGAAVTPSADAIISQVQFAVATPRVYIPFPAPGALSTWKGNGFGSLPIVIDQTTAYASVVSDQGDVATQSGPPMINNTEQVLLQGPRNKQYRITIPIQPARAGSADGG